MNNQIKNCLYYFYKFSFKTIIHFWLIYLGFIALFIGLAIMTDGSVEFMGVNALPSTIFMAIFGLIFFKDVFPYIVKFGVSRKFFIASTVIFSVLLTTMMISLNFIFLHFINWIIDIFKIENFTFTGLNMGELTDVSPFDILIFEWLLHFTLFILFILIGAILFRFGMKYGMLMIIILPLSLFIRPIANKVGELMPYFGIFHYDYTPFAFLPLIAAVVLLFGVTVQKASIVDQISHKS
ncbi:hypothetical protein [Amphibacillus cookii]|uniref:hypothetical protein n=1 Tax=Amphibacillus cookii TaxID=767787 RepID=UPI00195828A4|nr:hypothetical protein [Amphibacillus cookii]MBM7542970.1 ABC-2 type transport system permease protein [Amphibacillus cookii]